MRRVAVDFAFNSLLKDKVSPEARQWEKRRDEKELAKQIERLVAMVETFRLVRHTREDQRQIHR